MDNYCRQNSLKHPTCSSFNKLKYHTVGIFPKFNRKIVERGKIQILLQSKTLKKKVHDRSLSWLGTGTSSRGDKL